ncbi:MAG: TRAP transporter permease DctQ [Hyphomicrobiales bacterium]|nr:MAG: TRAP transporter permease DctQ [Hyphomicrobiales bacterium]
MFARIINDIEETVIAVLLGLMTLTTFSNVVARYVFNSNLLWALELTTFIFAWLVIFGASYGVKIVSHLGVDALVNTFSPSTRRILGLLAVAACIAYAAIMLKAGWDYWSKFAYKASFLETQDLPFPIWLQSLFGLVENGEATYERLPRYVPYFILPFGMLLLLLRFLQAAFNILIGKQTMVIASHEAEDMVAEAAQANKGEK